MIARSFLFAYGSLVRDAVVCHLGGHRRRWDVAMDNTRDLPGYKYYRDRDTGQRPPVYVTFLNLRPDEGSTVNGVAYPVEAEIFPLLDARERNYERCEVTDLVDVDLGGPVWAYVGTAEGRARYEAGRRDGTAVVSDEYYEGVRDGFARLGVLEEFERTTDALLVPRRALERIDLPDG